MPTYQLSCPICSHHFTGMVFAGSQLPKQWVCPECGSDQPKPDDSSPPMVHPLEVGNGGGCPCCGGAVHSEADR